MARSRHRDAIETLLREAEGPLSADEVRDALRDTGIGQATVYRLLNQGVEAGTFQPVELPTGPTRYEPADRPHHHHFECDACHRVFDLAGCPGRFDRLLPEGFSLASHDLTLHGRCADCQEAA